MFNVWLPQVARAHILSCWTRRTKTLLQASHNPQCWLTDEETNVAGRGANVMLWDAPCFLEHNNYYQAELSLDNTAVPCFEANHIFG